MYLNELGLKDFRNYAELQVEFSKSVNIFIGDNAQGKTNLLEAIYMLAAARSHRDNNDRDLIRWSASAAKISGRVTRNSGSFPLELVLSRGGKKVFVNHLPESKLSDYIGNLNVVLFAPEDLELVKGSPGIRRKFINSEFGQMSANYLLNLLEYRKVLKDRNAYLKNISISKGRPIYDKTYLQVLDDQLSDFGSKIIQQRFLLVKKLEGYAQKIHQAISGGEDLNIKYRTFPGLDDQSGFEDIRKIFSEQLAKNHMRELLLKTTMTGPHHDDLRFFIDGKEVSSFASQGQQRTTALSIRLAEIEMMKFETGEYPILLLDDVLSELDGNRQTQLLSFIQDKVQTFLTAPSLSDVERNLIKDPKIFRVENGGLIYE
ncbi:DNA replication/repair protein RecF [Oenococcus alcoholitolerans]|uniref:DNA replication/repair protein RecF n=1 Tax=Oenococcus alcoholitolerans TaxID=931074 RepID=UPI003F72B224